MQQVVHHLADAEMNAYFRFKRGLTEELPVAGTFREDLWAQLNDYKDTPVKAETLKGWLRVQRYGDMTLDVAVRKVLD